MTALYGQWDMSGWPAIHPYADTATYQMVADFLDARHKVIEDWGCGGAWLRKFIKDGHYRGVDGATAPWVNEQVDLRTYRSEVERANMRHVLEHNPDWEVILANFLESFTERATIVVFTQFVGEGCRWPNCPQLDEGFESSGMAVDHARGQSPAGVPDLHLPRDVFEGMLTAAGVSFTSESLETDSQFGYEEIFFLTR